MENNFGWSPSSQYFTKRWLQMHQPPDHCASKGVSSAARDRYDKAKRNFSAAGQPQSSSSTKYNVQELCLDNNKLLIIDSERQFNGLAKSFNQSVSFKELQTAGQKRSYLPKVSDAAKTQSMCPSSGQRGKFFTKKENKRTDGKLMNNLSQLYTIKTEQNEGTQQLKKITLSRRKKMANQNKLTFDVQETEYESPPKIKINIEVRTPSKSKRSLIGSNSQDNSKISNSHKSKKSLRVEKSPTKSLKSPSQRQKSIKSQRSVKSKKSLNSHKSHRSLKQKTQQVDKPIEAIDIVEENEAQSKANSILAQIPQQISQQLEINQDYVIAELLDPTELINFAQMSNRLMQNPYEDFPEWGQYPLETSPSLIKPQLLSSHNEIPGQSKQLPHYSLQLQGKEDKSEFNVLQRMFSLPVEQLEKSPQQLAAGDNNQPMQQRSIPNLQAEKVNDNDLRRSSSMKITIENQEQLCFDEKQRCLTTKATDKPLDSPTDQKEVLAILEEQIVQKPSKHSSIKIMLRRQKRYDKDFELKQHFVLEERISLIDIKLTNQTAFYPLNLKNSIYILPNPSNLSPYRNRDLTDLLNLFLKVRPVIVQELFEDQGGQFYRSRLYQGGQKRIVEVDGVFPFDENHYPLFGSVEQYIWFSVLVKAIAKLKGSYRQVSGLKFQDIFNLLTNYTLQQITDELLGSPNPSKFLKDAQRSASNSNLFILFTRNNQIYQLDKISYIKSAEELRQQQEQQQMIKIAKMRKSSKGENNMKSLANFINQQKNEIYRQRIRENTRMRLVGVQGKKNVVFDDILQQNFKIWMPRPTILQNGSVN